MNNLQIELILNSDEIVSKTFRGVYACDKIPTCNNKNECFVVNTQPQGLPGEHWVAIFKENNKKEYFDSYGFPPLVTEIKTFVGKNYRYNKATLQNFDSIVCGEYCIYFLYYRCRGYSMRNVVTYLLEESSRNDEIVDDFVRQRFEIPITLAFNQRCTRRHGFKNVYKGSVGDYPRSVDVEIGKRYRRRSKEA